VTGTDAPLVTVIVLCHNYGRYLGEAIESALAQTYPNLEVLVMDDGSTDDSLEVAQRYADRVRIISQPNMGMERTANRAVAEARGELFCFLSADDALEPTYVERLAAALERTAEAAYAYCRPMLFGARTGPMRCLPFSAYFLVRRTNFVAGSALTRRADYLAVGGYTEDLGEHAFEDWDLWLRMLERGRRGTYVREPLLRWRRHETGSRNPEQGAREAAARAFIRARHAALRERVGGTRGTIAYTLDLAVAAADLLVGFSRWQPLLRFIERSSWHRYRCWHVPKLRA
jgi:glycosyltransferase involved in cell wall biosynthesis